MSYDRDKYEKLINSSLLFSLDSEKEHIAYRREALKMVEYLLSLPRMARICDY